VIDRGKVIEAGPWSDEQVEAEHRRDRAAKVRFYGSRQRSNLLFSPLHPKQHRASGAASGTGYPAERNDKPDGHMPSGLSGFGVARLGLPLRRPHESYRPPSRMAASGGMSSMDRSPDLSKGNCAVKRSDAALAAGARVRRRERENPRCSRSRSVHAASGGLGGGSPSIGPLCSVVEL